MIYDLENGDVREAQSRFYDILDVKLKKIRFFDSKFY